MIPRTAAALRGMEAPFQEMPDVRRDPDHA